MTASRLNEYSVSAWRNSVSLAVKARTIRSTSTGAPSGEGLETAGPLFFCDPCRAKTLCMEVENPARLIRHTRKKAIALFLQTRFFIKHSKGFATRAPSDYSR